MSSCGPSLTERDNDVERVPYNSSTSTSTSTGNNALGVWLQRIGDTGYGSHEALASDLAAMGVKRIYVQVGDGTHEPSAWPAVADARVVETYHRRGMEVWAWSRNYAGDGYNQATSLYSAARVGYDGYVIDLGAELDGATSELHELMQQFQLARTEVIDAGVVSADFPIYCSTWGNPMDHDMHVEIIDQYVDAHMPQTYLEVWGPSYASAARHWVEVGTREYRDQGCVKPIHHVFSVAAHQMTSEQLNEATRASGPQTSLWHVPTANSAAVWALLRAANWHMSFDGEPAGSIVLNSQTEYTAGQPAGFSGSTQGDIRTILGIVDGVVVTNQPVDGHGNFEFQFVPWTVATQRSIAVEGYDVESRLVAKIQSNFDVIDQQAAQITLTVPPNATVDAPATFSGTVSSQITRVVVTVDGWQIGDEPVQGGSYAFDYSFTSAALGRQVVARGYDAQLGLVAQAVTYVDVVSDAVVPTEEPSEPPPPTTSVPYFYQYANSVNPGGSCQNTSMAMVLKHYGAGSVTPDSISGYWGTSQAQTVSGFQSVFNSEAAYYGLAVRDAGTQSATVADLRNTLATGTPVVVHGYFTSYGHVIVLVGFDGNRYTANDPAGAWNEVYQGGGYGGWNPTAGQYITYNAASLEAAVAPDGYVWMHEFYIP